jgi:hypothetical protein
MQAVALSSLIIVQTVQEAGKKLPANPVFFIVLAVQHRTEL